MNKDPKWLLEIVSVNHLKLNGGCKKTRDA